MILASSSGRLRSEAEINLNFNFINNYIIAINEEKGFGLQGHHGIGAVCDISVIWRRTDIFQIF